MAENKPDQSPGGFSSARYWDFMVGGHNNFEVDRQFGEKMINSVPDTQLGALANRAFLRRAVRFMTQQGIDQFIDLGSGIPTVGNVHETAHKVIPNAHTVYVDKDPVAVMHSQSILKEVPNTAVIEEDILNFSQLWEKIRKTGLIDLNKPMGVIMIAVMHFFPDDEQAYGLLKKMCELIPTGSYIVLSHFNLEKATKETVEKIRQLRRPDKVSSKARSLKEIRKFFEGFTLVDPGVVYVPAWRPEADDELLVEQPERALSCCGVGLKP